MNIISIIYGRIRLLLAELTVRSCCDGNNEVVSIPTTLVPNVENTNKNSSNNKTHMSCNLACSCLYDSSSVQAAFDGHDP